MLPSATCCCLAGGWATLHGQRRLSLAGIGLFSAAWLACGLAQAPAMLIAARAVQGLGGAVVSAVALSLVMNLFSASADRARAMGVCGSVCASGGSIGLLFGGLLTDPLGWHWIFLVNLPIGAAVVVMVLRWLPRDVSAGLTRPRLDVAGAVTVTVTLAMLGLALLLLFAFLVIERRAADAANAAVVVQPPQPDYCQPGGCVVGGGNVGLVLHFRAALASGYRLAFVIGALFAAAAGMGCALFMRSKPQQNAALVAAAPL